MAANKKLTKLFTEIADSIREVKDIVRPLSPSEFPEAIKGMDKRPVVERDINFYDYEGTLLYSYDISEIKNLKELPPLPYHEGLICQGWNWDYEDVIALDYPMNIGAMYITDDGKTRIHICIETMDYSTIPLYLYQSVSNGISIDWGDGSPIEALEGINNVSGSHSYAQVGEYVITLDPLDECVVGLGQSNNVGVVGNRSLSSQPTMWNNTLIRKVFFGKNITKYMGCCTYCYYLEEATFPAYWTQWMLGTTCSIKHINIPKNVKTLPAYSIASIAFYLKRISLPNGILELSMGIYGCTELVSLTLPDSITSISNMSTMNSLTSLRLPKNLVTAGNNCLQNCNQTTIEELPTTLRIIGTSAFTGVRLKKADIRGVSELKNSAFKNTTLRQFILPRKAEIMEQYFCSNTGIRKIVLPENLSAFETYAMMSNYFLMELYLPSTLQSIGVQAFAANWSCKFYDFTACNQVPVLSNSNAFQAIRTDCEIRVPEDLYEEWVAATNWATYADYIKPYPRTEYDYDALMRQYYGDEFTE